MKRVSEIAASPDSKAAATLNPPTPAVTEPDWIPGTRAEADAVIEAWTQRKIGALLRERGLDDEVETTRRFVIEAIPEYADRFLLELLQNGHDAMPAEGKGRIRIDLDLNSGPFGHLLVANTGTPFRYRDFRSLCRMAQSEKRPGEGIGHKGVGFKSVLQVAPHPEIYSAAVAGNPDAFHGFCFTFPDETQYRELLVGAGDDVPQMSQYSLPVTIPLERQPDSVRRLATEGYSTVICLPLGPLAEPTARRAIEEMLSSSAPVLLFLHRIGELVVAITGAGASEEHSLARTAARVAAAGRAWVEKVDLGDAGTFLVATGEADEETFRSAIAEDVEARRASDRWLDWKGAPEVSIAVPLEPRIDDRLYCYLPMDPTAHSPLAGHVNAPFAIGLARKELIPGSQINELLLNFAADVSVDAASALKSEVTFRASVLDLFVWRRDRMRIVNAMVQRGEDCRSSKFLPTLKDGGWTSFAGGLCWDPEGTTQLTVTALASLVADELVDPAIGRERLEAISSFGSEVLDIEMEPSAEKVAEWAEAMARHLHRRERASTPPATSWVDFYDDLSRVFPAALGRALAGKRILLGEDKELLEAWNDTETSQARRRVRRSVFFARSALDDPDADATEDNFVPRSLRRTLARVHPDLDWFVPGEAGRRNRPGRIFLEQQDLVRVPRIPDLLHLVERVVKGSHSPTVWRDALVFVYRITRPGPRRPDLGSLGLERLGLRVRAGGNWMPTQQGLFSRGWTDLGVLMSDLVESAGPVATEIAGLGTRLLDPADEWLPKRSSTEGWVELLGYCGVRDGLSPTASASTSSITNQGWWWQDPKRIADRYRMNDVDRAAWIDALDFGTWPHHSGADYVADGSPALIPGQSDFDRFPEKARSAFAHLMVSGLAVWPDSALWFEVYRRVGQGDGKRLQSPAQVFLRSARWLRVSRPGSASEDDWVAPRGAWTIQSHESEPYFAPVLDARLRSDLARSPRACERLVELGAHVWSDRAHAVAKLLLLGRLLHEGRVLSGLVAQVRNSILETWKAIVEGDPPLSVSDLREGFLVVARREQLETLPGSSTDSFFVRGSADRMLELVLASIGEPVLVASGDIGEKATAHLQASGFAGARLVWPTDLVVEVDGQPAGELLDGAGPLLAGNLAWLSDLVALTLELRPTEFRAPTQKIIQNALQRLGEIRLIEGEDIALRLDNQRREVPAYSRRVVPTAINGEPVIVWAPGDEGLTWRALRRLTPAIAELIQERGAREALENVVQALGDGGGLVDEPTDEQFADTFGVSVSRIGEFRRSLRGSASQVLHRLIPLVACIIDTEAAIKLRTRAIQNPNSEQGLADALEEVRDRLPQGLTVELLVEAASSSRRIGEAREKLGIEFGEMNRALVQFGPDYEAETYPALHASAMSMHLAQSRDRITDALRIRALEDGLESSSAVERYAEAVAALDSAIRVPRAPAADDLLAPSPAWLLDYWEPPDELLANRATAWLASLGAAPPPAEVNLPAASSLRASNGSLLSSVLPRMALVVGAWIDQHGVSAMPQWITDTREVGDQLAVSGRLDFVALDEPAVIAILVARSGWPAEMERTIDLAKLHLVEADLVARRTDDDRRRAVEERAKRGVEVAGRVVTLDPDTIGQSIDHIRATIAMASLSVPLHEVALGPPPVGRAAGRYGGKGGNGGRGRVPKEKLETIGLVGEVVAWVWLCHHYGEPKVMWRSENRAFVIHDGDPGSDLAGYDFEILHGHSRLFYEIKASTGDPREFELSEAEVRFALSKANSASYRILYIGYVNDSTKQTILPLPNPLAARTRDRYRALESGIRYAFRAV
jgi:Domain of unknown function (DUF3883)